MNATSSPSRNTPLNDRVNAYQSKRLPRFVVPVTRDLDREDRDFVVDCEPPPAQDRLAQPLEAEDEQQKADHEPQRVERDQGERRPERKR